MGTFAESTVTDGRDVDGIEDGPECFLPSTTTVALMAAVPFAKGSREGVSSFLCRFRFLFLELAFAEA